MDDIFRIIEPDPQILDAARDEVLSNLNAQLSGVRIEEVGSTAVDGVIGKGDLDLLVLAPREKFAATRGHLDSLYPRNPEQLSNDEYQGYLVPSMLDVAIQLTIEGTQYDTFLSFLSFLSFLDLLKSSAALRDAYNQLKRNMHGKPMTEYRAAKSQFIESALASNRQIKNST